MVLDGLRGYVQLANGLTEVTRERARAAAKLLAKQGEVRLDTVLPAPVKAQVAALTDDIVATGRANRALLVNLVRAEVERASSRAGIPRPSDLAAAQRRAQRLEERVADLEREVRETRAATTTKRRKPATKSTQGTAKRAAAKKTATKKTATKKNAEQAT